MKRTTITLPDELAVAVEREAHRRRTSVSQVTREALTAHLGVDTSTPRQLPFAALGASGTYTTARDIEEILADEWANDRRR
jgi:Arc/MetJ-type ribon-helix-helix transcriptional regulator